MTGLPPARKPHYVGRSTLLPLLGARSGFLAKTHFLPILAAVLTAILVPLEAGGAFSFIDIRRADYAGAVMVNEVEQVIWTLGAFVTFLIVYYVYMLCGRRKPWWLLAGVFLAMALLLTVGPVREIVAAWNGWVFPLSDPQPWEAYFGPGVSEELAKVLPVFFLVWVGRRNAAFAKRIGVFEPLDGILIGVVSATGFALVETAGLYSYMPINDVIAVVDQIYNQYCAGQNPSDLCGALLFYGYGTAAYHALIQSLIRVLGSICGHMAWSGVFGYFIGLAVLRPRMAFRLVLFGWVCAGFLHGSFDAVITLGLQQRINLVLNEIFAIAISLVSYLMLAAAIFKARQLSPTRAENFATVVGPAIAPYAPPPVPPAVPPSHKAQPAAAAPHDKLQPAGTAALVLKIGTVTRPVVAGTSIEPVHLGLAGVGRGNGPIAEVVPNPGDPAVLGLQNLSDRVYRATMPDGKTIEIARGQTARLAAGVVVDFGGIEGSVQPA